MVSKMKLDLGRLDDRELAKALSTAQLVQDASTRRLQLLDDAVAQRAEQAVSPDYREVSTDKLSNQVVDHARSARLIQRCRWLIIVIGGAGAAAYVVAFPIAFAAGPVVGIATLTLGTSMLARDAKKQEAAARQELRARQAATEDLRDDQKQKREELREQIDTHAEIAEVAEATLSSRHPGADMEKLLRKLLAQAPGHEYDFGVGQDGPAPGLGTPGPTLGGLA